MSSGSSATSAENEQSKNEKLDISPDYPNIGLIKGVTKKLVVLEIPVIRAPPTEDNQSVQITVSLEAACVSNFYRKYITEIINSNDSKNVFGGKIIIKILTPTVTDVVAKHLMQYLEYHSNDKQFERETFIDEFEEDPFEIEQKRLQELPCFWDWSFISNVGGGPVMQAVNRGEFYDLMILAERLDIPTLLELGSKYIAKQIDSNELNNTRMILGLSPPNQEEVRR